MGIGKHIKKKKSHIKASKSKKHSKKHTKKHSKTKSKKYDKKSNNLCPSCKCKNITHEPLRCPKIWRTYVLKENSWINDRPILPIHTVYCYRCGGKGHLGDDCFKSDMSTKVISEDSAFSGKNLEQPLSKIYYKTLKRQNENSDSFDGKYSTYSNKKLFHFYRPPYTTKK